MTKIRVDRQFTKSTKKISVNERPPAIALIMSCALVRPGAYGSAGCCATAAMILSSAAVAAYSRGRATGLVLGREVEDSFLR